MPRIGIGLLILLVAVVLPGRGMAKSTAESPCRTQMFSEFDDVCAEKQGPWLRPGELFTISVLPEISFSDSQEQRYIDVKCISLAEIFDDISGERRPVIERASGEFDEEVSFASSELSIIDLIVMAWPYELMIEYYEMPLPGGTGWQMTFGL
jgi:hypothetical protein